MAAKIFSGAKRGLARFPKAQAGQKVRSQNEGNDCGEKKKGEAEKASPLN
jgi:hypothetical protein